MNVVDFDLKQNCLGFFPINSLFSTLFLNYGFQMIYIIILGLSMNLQQEDLIKYWKREVE